MNYIKLENDWKAHFGEEKKYYTAWDVFDFIANNESFINQFWFAIMRNIDECDLFTVGIAPIINNKIIRIIITNDFFNGNYERIGIQDLIFSLENAERKSNSIIELLKPLIGNPNQMKIDL